MATTYSTEPPIPRGMIRTLGSRLGVSMRGWNACPPRWCSPSPGSLVEGAYFDVDAVVRVVEQLRRMPHTKGKWGGQPFEPAPWQIVWILAPVFGWKHSDGTRIVRLVWDEVPRKNGKSSLAARLGIVLLVGDGEMGAEVYAAAGSKDQARFVFDEAAKVAKRSRALKGKAQVLAGSIRGPKLGGVFRVLSKEADLAFGANVHGGIIDEIHVHKSRALIDAIETGTGAREQPLIFEITTADEGDDLSIYGVKHNYAIRLAEGAVVDPSTYVVIWAAEKGDDPFAERTWRKANPNFPVSPTQRYLETEARKAREQPSTLPSFLRLSLNVRAAEEGTRIDWDWMASAGMVVEDKLKGRPCWGGLVTRSAQDLTAICWTFRSPEVVDEWWALWRHFLPADRLPSLAERTNGAAPAWVKSGALRLTEGDVIDVAAHLEQLQADAERFSIQELAYDPNGAIGIVSAVLEWDRFEVVPIYANSPGSSLVDWEALVRSEKYRHGANPLMAWQMSGLMLRESAGGVTKIDPKASADVVPGPVAGEISLRRALLAQQPFESAYADHGLLSV